MTIHSDYDVRMKDYEKRFTDVKLLPRVPAIIRADGVAFHTYTKMDCIERPFSNLLHDAMCYAVKKTCSSISGIKAVYTQSDEISFWLSDESEGNTHSTQGWYDWKLQKLTSVTASILTAHFNSFMNDAGVDKLAYFDCRAFSLPESELNNYFWWRQKDASKNSVAMLAQSLFSHKELQGLSGNQMQEKMLTEKDVNWNDLDIWKRRGTLITRQERVDSVTYYDKRTDEHVTKPDVIRRSWEELDYLPLFTKVGITELV